MKNSNMSRSTKIVSLLSAFLIYLLIFSVPVVMGHGGKTHGDSSVSSLQIVEKATKLYTQLVTKGKLPEAWETDLTNISIETRMLSGKTEYVVQYKRKSGNPNTVYFFFDNTGKYSGSNFTGK